MMTESEDEMLEYTAAELTAALHARETAPLPAALAARIVSAGQASMQPVRTESAPRRTTPWLAWSGWLAAAAVLVVAIGGGRRGPQPATVPAITSITAVRDSLLGGPTTVVRVPWTATADTTARGATGDVVWSQADQRGVMRFTGLAPNDPTTWQYQLWVFDATRDERYPVDGGVFDIPPGRTTVDVPIAVRVPVGRATMFAVTIERAGGVVVSTRERIAVLAKLGA